MNRTMFTASLLGALGAAGAATPRLVGAAEEAYPTRPITLIVPWGPGGGSDQLGRAVAKVLDGLLKTATVPVINVPGADGNDGMVKLINADADGYTMAVFIADTFVGNMNAKKSELWSMSQIVPIAIMNRMPFAFHLSNKSPYKNWADFEKAAKTKQMRVAVDSYGSAQDVGVRYFASKGQLKLVEVPFPKPGERYAALLGGQVDIMCDAIGNVSNYILGGQMRPICVFAPEREKVLPSVPTATEVGYRMSLEEWRSVAVRSGTPPQCVAFLDNLLATAYKTPEFQAFLKSSWSDPDSYIPGKDLEHFFGEQRRNIATLMAATH
jgi:tripartite-type tricarboxylate transporter receptor subunit TctC